MSEKKAKFTISEGATFEHGGETLRVVQTYLQVDTPKGMYSRILCVGEDGFYHALSGNQIASALETKQESLNG